MVRRSTVSNLIVTAVLSVTIALVGCGGKNGLIGTGGGASLTSLSLTPTNPSVALAVPPTSTVAFDVIGHYTFGNPQDITTQMMWTTADPTVATINSKGVATAVNSGRVIITGTITDPVSQGIFTVNTILTVVPQLTAITISPSSAQIAKGTSQQFVAVGTYNDGTTPNITSLVTWNSTQTGVAAVSSSPGTQGLARAAGQGSTNITATLGTVSSMPSSLTVSTASLVSIAITPATQTVGLATSQPLTATGTFSDATTQDLSGQVMWSTLTAHSRVARVSAMGVVTGLGLGGETITATDPFSNISNSAGITVDDSSVASVEVVPVAMVKLAQALSAAPIVANGTAQQMRAIATLKDGSTVDVTGIQGVAWSSTDPAVATIIPATGLMTTAGSGSTNIMAAVGSEQGGTPLTVVPATLQSLVVAPDNAHVAQGGIQNVVALATFLAPDNLTLFQQDVSNVAVWTGDANASVSYFNGLEELATGIATGTSNISASFAVPGGNPLSAGATLNVTAGQLGTISLVPGSASVPLDGGRQFRATGNFTDGTQADLSLLAAWESSNEAITTVSPFGFTDASGPGQTSVTASFVNSVTNATITGSGSVVVNPGAITRIDICASTVSNPLSNCPPLDPVTPPGAISFANQTQFGLVAIATFSDGSRQDLTDAVRWTSGTPSAASISNDPGIPGITTGVGGPGVMTAGILGGATLITASAGGVSGSSSVQVSAASPESIAITPANGIVALGTPQQFKVTGSFSDGSKQDLTSTVQWSSLNPDIAIVTPGGLAYSTGKGIAAVSTAPSALGISLGSVTVTLVNPSATSVFPWPVGSVFLFQSLTVSSGDVSLLVNTPLTIVSESDPADPQHLQPCKPGLNCNITFVPPPVQPTPGTYTVTGGTAQASAVITATANVVIDTIPTQVSGSTTLTVQ
jgi:hypothetical protein